MVFAVLIAAGGDDNVRVTVAIEIGKGGIHIFKYTVLSESGHLGGGELPRCVLKVNATGFEFRGADEEIHQTVTVQISRGQRRPFGRNHVGNQRLAVEIDKLVLPVEMPDAVVRGHVGELSPGGGPTESFEIEVGKIRVPVRACFTVKFRRRKVRKGAVGPHYYYGIHAACIAQPNVHGSCHRRLKAAHGIILVSLPLRPTVNDHAGTDGIPVGGSPAQGNR